MMCNISPVLTARTARTLRCHTLRPITVGLFLACLAGCASTQLEPLTGQTEPATLEKDEQTLWTAADKLESEIAGHLQPAASRARAEKYLDGVLRKLTPDFEPARVRVRIRVLPDSNPNAFILPNGAMYVNTGLLALLDNEAQIATVLGHEFCHFRNRHSYRERIKEHNELVKGALVGRTLSVLLGTPNVTSSMAELWRISSVSGYSRNLESEADHASLLALLQAGYQPDQATRAFERLQSLSREEESKKDRSFATHPKLDDRIASYRKCLQQPEMQPYASGREVAEAAYNEAVFDLILDNAELNLEEHHYDLAGANVERCLKRKPDSARAHFLQGELWRTGPGTEGDPWQRALACYDQALRYDPNFATAHRETGLLHRQLGDRVRAAASLRKYQELGADAVDAPIVKAYGDKLADTSEVVPPPYHAPPLTKEDFRDKARTVGILPLVVPDGITNVEKKREEFESALAEKLKQAGFSIVPSSAYSAIYEATKKSMGALYDPNTGAPLEDRRDAVAKYALREYLAAHTIDALAYPAVIVVAARWDANRAVWHGVREASTGQEGFWADLSAPSAYGTMTALSFRLALADTYDTVCFVGLGGVQLCSRVAGGGFTEVPAHELLTDPAKNARSVEIACQALVTRTR